MDRIRSVSLDLRKGDDWIEVDYTFGRTAGRRNIGEGFIIGRAGCSSDGPEHDLMTIRTRYPYRTLEFRTRGTTEPALDLWNVYIPRDRGLRKMLVENGVPLDGGRRRERTLPAEASS